MRALPLTPEALIETARAAGVLVPAHLTVFDVVYAPLETTLLRQARRSGAHAIDGLGMLERQGARALDVADIDRASVDIDRASVDIDRASVDIDRASADIDHTSDEVAALMRAACGRALEARSAT